jgi:outer membrane protein
MTFRLKTAAALVFLAPWTWITTSQAQETAPTETAAAEAAPVPAVPAPSGDSAPLVLPEERRWRLGAALGYGERSNPLIQSDDIPVVLDIDVAYFGNRWFFDNGDLGLQLLDNAVTTTNLVARVNSDRAFFSKTNTRYVSFSIMGGGLTTALYDPRTGAPVPPEATLPPQPLKPPKRDYAIELGFESLFSGEWGQATLRAFHDVSGTHDGYEVSADYSYRMSRGRFSLSPMVGVSWKNAALSDYYWGVHADEVSFTLQPFEARGGVGWEAGLRTNYHLTKSTRLAVSANYERLHHSVAQSPLVKRDYVFGYFAGIGWQF